jgi:hypothetical protein
MTFFEFFDTQLGYILLLAFTVVAVFLDYYISEAAPYYGLPERNDLIKNKNGDIDLFKAILAAAFFVGLSMIFAFTVAYGAGSCILAPIALSEFGLGFLLNVYRRRRNRKAQLVFLNDIAAGGLPVLEGKLLTFQTTNNQTFLPLFRWIKVPSPNGYTPEIGAAVLNKIIDLAKQNPLTWFPK